MERIDVPSARVILCLHQVNGKIVCRMAEGSATFPLVKKFMLVNQLRLGGMRNKTNFHTVVYLS